MDVSEYSGTVLSSLLVRGLIGCRLLGNLSRDFLIFLLLNGILRIMFFQYDLPMG